MEKKISESNQEDEKKYCFTHEIEDKCTGGCQILNIFSILGKRHTMPIIRILLLRKILRFNELLQFVGGSPRTLSIRLKEMEQYGLIIRTVFNEIPIRVEYQLTQAGLDLEPMFQIINDWAHKYANISIDR